MNTAKTNENLLMHLMGLDALEYHNHVMDVAYEYLEKNIGKDKFGKNLLLNSKSFWVWWRIQWDRRNRLFIHEASLGGVDHIIQPDTRTMIKDLYMETHSVNEIHVYPSRMVMEDSYAKMIGQVFDEAVMVKKGGNNE